MISKILFKIDSKEFNNRYGVPLDMNSIRQEVCSLRNNKIITRRIIGSGIDFAESIFDQKNIAEVILSNIEIQFALYQFYVFYSAVENKEDRSKEKLTCEICYPKEDSKLSDLTLSNLLSIFDSLVVVYKEDKTIVVARLSSLESQMKIYNIYRRLYEESLLNPFILTFITENKGDKLEDVSSSIYQYQPCEDDINAIVLNKNEMIFINFIEQQLILSNYFMFYCLGWNVHDVTTSMTLKKLAKYHKRIFFTSTSDRFLSQLLMIADA